MVKKRQFVCVSVEIVRVRGSSSMAGAAPALPRPRRMATVEWAEEVDHGWLLRKHWAPTTPIFLEQRLCCFVCSYLMGKASSAKRL